MAAFLVLSPPGASAEHADCRFVRDGFSWTAAIFPVLWAIGHGLYRDAIVLALIRLGGLIALASPGFHALGWAVLLASGLICGFEARHRHARALVDRGWRDRGVITAIDLAEAEAIHYGVNEDAPSDLSPQPSVAERIGAARPGLHLGMIELQKGR